ncbi:MAG: type II secretion system F family protein [Candidatus Omnitrophota bacterium]
MPNFKYTAKDHNARDITGNISAENEDAVVKELRSRDLMVVSVVQVKEGADGGKKKVRGKKVKPDDLVIFARQLATMIEAGIPILQALEALHDQMSSPYFQQVIASLRDEIQLGNSLSSAFAKHPKVFDALFVNMVRVGETGGVLSTILDRVAGYMEKTLKLKRKVKSALVYPCVVVFMAMVITTVLMVKVVPSFAGIYDSFDAELPGLTKLLISISEFFQWGLPWLAGGIVIFSVAVAKWYQTDTGRLAVDRVLLKMPLFGDLLRKVAISRFSRTLAILLQSGVPILDSLDIVGKSSGNRVIELVVDNVKEAVREGESIAAPLLKSPVFPPMVTRMIAIGEKSGKLQTMLNKIAEFYEDQVDAAVAGLTSIIEPVIIGVLGIVIGFIVIALFMPILNMAQLIQA